MTTTRNADYAALVLRISLGVMFLLHGTWLKGVVFTLAGTAAYFTSIGLPAFLAYVVFAAETVGGLLLIAGVRTRWVAAALIPILLGATWAHGGNGWLFTNEGGGWEYPAFLTAASVAQILLGDGAYAVRFGRLRSPRQPAEASA